tara:strand:+ start:248 stop:517 length:270 start_codon:yes stop_codon:yes gene_type:complete
VAIPEDLAIGETYSDEPTILVPFANSLTKNTNKTVRRVNADMVIHVFLSLEIFIVYKNPRATVIKPKTGIGGKIDMLSNIPKLKSLLGL